MTYTDHFDSDDDFDFDAIEASSTGDKPRAIERYRCTTFEPQGENGRIYLDLISMSIRYLIANGQELLRVTDKTLVYQMALDDSSWLEAFIQQVPQHDKPEIVGIRAEWYHQSMINVQ